MASASAKTILFGEHAVVYGEPAIAVPLSEIRTRADFVPNGECFRIDSDKSETDLPFSELPDGTGLKVLIRWLCEAYHIPELPKETLTIRSDIPIASGLGSGAALSAAVCRAFAERFGFNMSKDELNAAVYEIEKIYHGNPSGIDNTTIVYEHPILFTRGSDPQVLPIPIPRKQLLVISTGIYSPTAEVVADVRAHYPENAEIIRSIGALVREALPPLKACDLEKLGELMNENHYLLQKLEVSCRELDELQTFALRHGAVGAKLTGAGRGGNLIALAPSYDAAYTLRNEFRRKGAHVIL